MTSLSEIPVVRVPSPEELLHGDAPSAASSLGTWSPVEMPRGGRPSPIALVVLALLAGIGALVLGAMAVVSATASPSGNELVEPMSPASAPLGPDVERQALSLLAKPSTDRVVFRGTGGRLVLAVGSGGRAVILARGFERATSKQPYIAWVIRSGKATRAARLVGAERAVVLTARVGRGDSVVVAPEGSAARRPAHARIVAVRG